MSPVDERGRAVVVMGRIPRAGRVKTRLTRVVTEAEAADLYRVFLGDVFRVVDAAFDGRRQFSCALFEDQTMEDVQLLLPKGWQAVAQVSGGLGDKIEGARNAADAAQVLILGSDAPTMKPSRLTEAFDALAGGADAVFGPTQDGGYDLIGLPGPRPELLNDIPWSTEQVMQATEQAAISAGYEITKLSVGYDIDHPEDLLRALADAERAGSIAGETARAIREVLDRYPDLGKTLD